MPPESDPYAERPPSLETVSRTATDGNGQPHSTTTPSDTQVTQIHAPEWVTTTEQTQEKSGIAVLQSEYYHAPDSCSNRNTGTVLESGGKENPVGGSAWVPTCKSYKSCAACRKRKADRLGHQIRWEARELGAKYGWRRVTEKWNTFYKRQRDRYGTLRLLRIPQRDGVIAIVREEVAWYTFGDRLEPTLYTWLSSVPGGRVEGSPRGDYAYGKPLEQQPWGGPWKGAWKTKNNPPPTLYTHESIPALVSGMQSYADEHSIVPPENFASNSGIDLSWLTDEQREEVVRRYAPDALSDYDVEQDIAMFLGEDA